MNEPATPATPAVHLHQIAYSAQSLAAVEPGYRVLDNLANPRPDWYEYWPVRRFLMEEPLDEQAFYGFFSPKFGGKTGLSHAEVQAIVQAAAPKADVVLFSPHPNQIAFFWNVFEQGDYFHPGLMDTCLELMDAIGHTLPLRQLVMDSRQTVFCNFFVARPAFWREWLHWNELLFAICEDTETPLQSRLTAPTSYTGGAQMKIFAMERMASLLLTLQPQWRTHTWNPYTRGWPTEALRQDPTQALCSDALKHAFRTQGFPEYLQAFSALRQQVMGLPQG